MKNKRRKLSTAFKTKVVLEALSERYTIQELGRKYEVHATQINKWKAHFLEHAESVFENGNSSSTAPESTEEKLYKVIGEQKVEIDFLKKALS
jgi:transposase